MYKYFAKTQFIGKKVEYLTQCHSSNEELAIRVKNGKAQEGHVLVAGYQTAGKGQRGNIWLSEPDKNLLVSIYLKPNFLPHANGYRMNVMVGVALREALLKFLPSRNIEIKWPNDIYVNDRKVAGVLVETNVAQSQVGNTIVGIGLNVNQKYFQTHNSTSLSVELGFELKLEEVLEVLLEKIEANYLLLERGDFKRLLFDYYQGMRWRGEIHQYETSQGRVEGEIIGINDKGRLMVKHNSGLHSYDIKEIKFIS